MVDSATSPASGAAASARTPIYEGRSLQKAYDNGQVQALRGMDFSILEGEFVAIVGPSGCGKTTLLQMLGGLDHPDSGTLLYRGTSLAEMTDPASYRSKEIGFVFQSFQLLPTFTSIENVQIPMFEQEKSARVRGERATSLLRAVGLEHRLNHMPGTLSGGERQRVAIARSLANSPSVLLADEPTGNLDSASAGEVLDLILRLRDERNMTLILVTHDMSIAARAHRTIQMKDGRILLPTA